MIDLSDFTTGQVAFITQLAANTGLDPGVCAAWCYAEENGSAAAGRQASGYHDWLNIGWADSGRTAVTYDPAWGNPTAAANATGNWLQGRFGQQYNYVASPGVQAILTSTGSGPAAQIAKIQGSGWASGGYPLLGQVYADLAPQLKQSLGAGVAKGGVAGVGGSGTTTDGSASTTYAFSISGVGNPDEDYWTGINRLAQEVNWYLFSDGEYLYYLDGQEMLAQAPAATLDRIADAGRIYQSQGTLSYDNTAFNYVSDHKRRYRTQRRTKVAIAQSPTEGSFQLICGIDEIMGGDVIELVNFGPGDGRWIVAECRRSVFDVYSELTLVPALAPISELAAAGTSGKPSSTGEPSKTINLSGSYPVSLTGTTRNRVVQVALAACAREKATGAYEYVQNGVLPSSLFGPAPVKCDCAAFSRICYKDAGAPDPMGQTPPFSAYANSTALFAHGTAVSVPQPGDLCFFGPGGSTHVNVYVGNGQVANMGAPHAGEPVVESLQGVSAAISGGLAGVRSYL